MRVAMKLLNRLALKELTHSDNAPDEFNLIHLILSSELAHPKVALRQVVTNTSHVLDATLPWLLRCLLLHHRLLTSEATGRALFSSWLLRRGQLVSTLTI